MDVLPFETKCPYCGGTNGFNYVSRSLKNYEEDTVSDFVFVLCGDCAKVLSACPIKISK